MCVRACVRVCVCTPLYLIHALKNKDSNDITFVASVCIQLVSVFFYVNKYKNESRIYPNMCDKFGVLSDGRVEKRGGGTQTHKQTHTHQGCGQVPVLVLVLVLKYNFIST